MARARVPLQTRVDPGGRVSNAGDGAIGTAAPARRPEWLEARYAGREDEVAGLLAHHWLAADDEDKAVTYLATRGDRARQEYALDEAIGSLPRAAPDPGAARRAIVDRAGAVQARAGAARVAPVQ
mgnify:CR=1 FL=1